MRRVLEGLGCCWLRSEAKGQAVHAAKLRGMAYVVGVGGVLEVRLRPLLQAVARLDIGVKG
ncbi:unnamed protein product [Fusarium graminearum]|nr:unnamed protein product [Fusarium graminearum]